jgi:hypothetical protein
MILIPISMIHRLGSVLALLAGMLFFPISSTKGEDAWQPLFNGKDLSGWTVKCRPEDASLSFWTVEDGAIQADSLDHKGHNYVWLYSDQEFDDFVLRLKFQAFRSSPGNSGVQIRSRYDDSESWLNGPQIDIHPTGPWRTGMIWDETRGVQRWLYPPVPKGEWVDPSMAVEDVPFYYSDDDPSWNQLEISAIGYKLKARLNGVEIMNYDGAGVLNDEAHQKAGTGTRGHIALQIHSGDQLKIRFKDIEILEK